MDSTAGVTVGRASSAQEVDRRYSRIQQPLAAGPRSTVHLLTTAALRMLVVSPMGVLAVAIAWAVMA
ncbi:MAG TPA: hypothetical protein VGK24_04150 [Candidatus Angelobacter sp.]